MSEVRGMGEEVLVNVYQARDILGVSLRTIYNMMNDGRLKRGERNPSMITRGSVEKQAQSKAKCN